MYQCHRRELQHSSLKQQLLGSNYKSVAKSYNNQQIFEGKLLLEGKLNWEWIDPSHNAQQYSILINQYNNEDSLLTHSKNTTMIYTLLKTQL